MKHALRKSACRVFAMEVCTAEHSSILRKYVFVFKCVVAILFIELIHYCIDFDSVRPSIGCSAM